MEGRQQIIKSQQMLKCPYDPNHNVPKETFFKHLDKCKSTYKDLFTQCPFNPFHWPKKQVQAFRRHCKECPNRLKWLELEASKSQAFELLLQPQITQVNLSASMANLSLGQSNAQSQLNQSSWLGNGFVQQPNQIPVGDNKSLYFSKANGNNSMAQSQVWNISNSIPSPDLAFSQLKPQNSFYQSQYEQKFVPPPSSVYSQPQFTSPYGYQYPQFGNSFGNQYMEQPYQQYDQYDENENEWNQEDEQDYEDDKRRKEKKEKKEKKDKKEKKEKKDKSR